MVRTNQAEQTTRGAYGTVAEFLELTENEWFQMLTEGCRKIGRNLNDTRGLFHSFQDSYEVMKNLFADLSDADVKFDDWEILFELRIKKSKYIKNLCGRAGDYGELCFFAGI